MVAHKQKNNSLRFIFPAAIFISISILVISMLNVLSPKEDSYCANSISCIKNLSVDIENGSLGTFEGQKIVPPKIDLAAEPTKTKVLGDNTQSGEKHIYVDLTHQTLYAYQGNNLFLQTLVSTGKWRATPTGDFKIWIRLRATRMTGGTGADYYDLPNVPYVMFFAGDGAPQAAGFSLHGAYWHNNFGHSMSHGCINMRSIDAQKIYDWIDDPKDNPTTVTVYGQADI